MMQPSSSPPACPATTPQREGLTRRGLAMRGLAGAVAVTGAGGVVLRPGRALAMGVRPVVFDLGANARTMSAPMEISNGFDQPLTVELTVQELTFPEEPGGQPTLAPTEDVLLFPIQAIIPVGDLRNVRVQYVGSPAITRSRHFLVTIAQVPVQLPSADSAVQIVYNFEAIVNVGVPGQRSMLSIDAARVASAEGTARFVPELVIRNTSQTYGYLADQRLRLLQRDASGAEVFRQTFTPQQLQQVAGLGLIGPGQVRAIQLPVSLPTGEGTLEAELTLSANRR